MDNVMNVKTVFWCKDHLFPVVSGAGYHVPVNVKTMLS